MDKAVKMPNRGAVGNVSTVRVIAILLIPLIAICWILLIDPGLFGR